MVGHQIVGLAVGLGALAASLAAGHSALAATGFLILGCNVGLLASAGLSLALQAWRRRPRPMRVGLAAGSYLVAVLGALLLESRIGP